MPHSPRRKELSVAEYAAGVRARDVAILGRAITLIESQLPRHQQVAADVLRELLPDTGRAHRVGITGVPGVGKSTFIEAFGQNLTAAGHRVAVLAIDPSSTVSGGSILGDKTRMARLAVDPNAFIRPSPNAGTLGGVARKTRETMLLCEAAGFEVILVETVGVGQSETVVAEMVDFFLVLMLAGAGDELQGIKRGVLEIADAIAINKADGANLAAAKAAAKRYARALHLMRPANPPWQPPVLTCSALENAGLRELWAVIEKHREVLVAAGEWDAKRRRQHVRWMWRIVEDRLLAALRRHPAVRETLPGLEAQVAAGTVAPSWAADEILRAFGWIE